MFKSCSIVTPISIFVPFLRVQILFGPVKDAIQKSHELDDIMLQYFQQHFDWTDSKCSHTICAMFSLKVKHENRKTIFIQPICFISYPTLSVLSFPQSSDSSILPSKIIILQQEVDYSALLTRASGFIQHSVTKI